MARHSFGGDMAAWAFTVGAGNAAVLASNVPVTFWSLPTLGVQYTDLTGDQAGTIPLGAVMTGNGTTAPVGDIPLFWGPDNITSMWASANGGPRRLIVANDVLANAANKGDDQTFTGINTFGPTGNVNDNRIILYAEATGQVGDVVVAYSGTDTGEGGQRQRTFYLNEKGELRVIAAKANSVAVRIKGQPTQTQHVLEQTDTSNNPISWWEPNGSWRAPNLGHTFVMSIAGNLVTGTGKHRIYNDTGVPLLIRAIRASVGTAPTGAAIRVDVNKNGTTLFTTQANRPNIAAAGFTSKVTNMDVTAFADGDYLTVDVDQVGSTVAGADLTVQILAY